jgi:hypothetical protein
VAEKAWKCFSKGELPILRRGVEGDLSGDIFPGTVDPDRLRRVE